MTLQEFRDRTQDLAGDEIIVWDYDEPVNIVCVKIIRTWDAKLDLWEETTAVVLD